MDPASPLSTPRWALIRSALLLCAICASGLVVINEYDIAWYMAAGERLLDGGGEAGVDPFSYTATRPWANHMWLTQVLLALVYRAAGWVGVGLWQALLLTLTMAALMLGQRWSRPPGHGPAAGASPLVYAVSAMLLREFVSPRGQWLSNVLFAATLALTTRHWSASQRPASAPLPPAPLWPTLVLGLIWTQVHGGNPSGVLLLALLTLAGPSKRRALYTGAAALLTLVGPHGYHVHEHYFASRGTLVALKEWYSLAAALELDLWSHLPYVLLLGAAAGALIWRSRRGEPMRYQALTLGLYTLAAARHVRFLAEGTLVATSALAPACADLLRPANPRQRRLAIASVLAAALTWIAISMAASPRVPGFGLAANRFPVGATAYLQRARLPGPMFNSYNFGGYLAWRYPAERVFIDGRGVSVYDPGQVTTLLQIYDDPRRFSALQRQHGLRLAVLQRRGRGAGLVRWLARQPDWKVMYADQVAVILARAD